MPLLARSISAPVVVEVRSGAVGSLAPLLADGRISTGGKVAIAVGPGRGDAIVAELEGTLPDATLVTIAGGSVEAAQELIAHLRGDYHDALVGVGGGRTLDAAKYAASLLGLPFVSVPTTLTHDGIASPVASLESFGRKASFGVHIPIAVFVDIDHVRDAPPEHTASGVGDVLSNLSAIADWELARDVRGEAVDGVAVAMARSAAEAIIDLGPGDDRFVTTLAESLVLSGLAMAVAGSSRPCSGACHEISHALDALHGGPGLHGAQVGLGARFATWLREDEAGLTRLDRALTAHGLPRHPEDLGLTVDQFVAAVAEAPATRPDRVTILEHLSLERPRLDEVVHAFCATVDR